MQAAIILLIEICLFLQMLLFEDMDAWQRCMWTVLLFCLPVAGAILYIVPGSSWPARCGKSRKAEPPSVQAACVFCYIPVICIQKRFAGIKCSPVSAAPVLIQEV